MKKFLTVLMTLVLIFSLCSAAFADTVLTINDDGVERVYDAFQLLKLTTSLKGDDHHPATCDGTNHADDCYNYAYTVNEKYRDYLQKETFAHGGNYLWAGVTKPTAAAGVTDEKILEYLANQTGDNGTNTLRQVADRLYRAIKAEDVTADKSRITSTGDIIAEGYWMIVDVTDLNGENEANSLAMVDTRGQNSITVKPKTALPTVEKKVKDIDDSEQSSIVSNPWQDSADHDIGDTVPFKLTGTLPSNVQSYQSYKLVFHDELSAGLTLDPLSIRVLMYDTKYRADVDIDMNDGEDVTGSFTKTIAGLNDGCSFEVGCEDVFTIEGVTKDTAFVVYYEATLNENAVIGSAGNPNEVYLEFSNNPYDESTGETEKDKVIVFTYQLVINKTDSHDHPLAGAGFTLSKKKIDGTYVVIGSELKGDDMTTFSWTGLDDGDYKLEETTVPEGYNKMADIVFSISAVHSENDNEPVLNSLDGGQMGTGVVDTGTITNTVVNNTGTVLPETGAKGTMMIIGCSAMVVILAAVVMITRKKMSVYED